MQLCVDYGRFTQTEFRLLGQVAIFGKDSFPRGRGHQDADRKRKIYRIDVKCRQESLTIHVAGSAEWEKLKKQ